MSGYTEKEKFEFYKCIESGIKLPSDSVLFPDVIVPNNYQVPYTVETIGGSQLEIYDWFNPEVFRWIDGSEFGSEFPKRFYRVIFVGDVPMPGFYKTFTEARIEAEKMNTRHFKLASLSTNKEKPILV